METAALYKMIDEIDWPQYETAYGNAAQDIPHFQCGQTPSVPRCLGEDGWIYALDWQHSGFRYDPRLPITEHDHWVEDERFRRLGGGYNAYFPDFYPDGDYYFFVQRDLEWGWLGHPWRREIWIFGDPLLDALSPTLETLGFPVKEKYTR